MKPLPLTSKIKLTLGGAAFDSQLLTLNFIPVASCQSFIGIPLFCVKVTYKTGARFEKNTFRSTLPCVESVCQFPPTPCPPVTRDPFHADKGPGGSAEAAHTCIKRKELTTIVLIVFIRI